MRLCVCAFAYVSMQQSQCCAVHGCCQGAWRSPGAALVQALGPAGLLCKAPLPDWCACLWVRLVWWPRFPGWRLQQEEGFNLLLYGFGSKQDLLQDYLVFCCRADPDTAVVVANGAVPTCSIKSIADAITKRIVGTTIRFSSLLEHCRFIAIQMGGGDGLEGVVGSSGGGGGGGGGSGWARRDATSLPRVLLAIHNIDGPALRSPEAQTALRSVLVGMLSAGL